ncbi:unknown [Clostridium sp. CAG:921]|nr:unknown [Clostridium sp. CAG:921]
MQKGDKVAIYYNPKSPGDFSTKSVFWMLANLLGIFIIAIGCAALWKVLKFMGYMPDVKKKKNLE